MGALISIKSEGKGLKKFWETVQYWSSPWIDSKHMKKMTEAEVDRIKRIAEAQADETKVLGDAKIEYETNRMREIAKAKREIISEEDLANYDLLQRAQQRFLHDQIDNQYNIDNVIFKSQKYLTDDVNDEPVNKEWIKRFFDRAKDISEDEVQELWAKILSGEVKKPGTFDYRTLDILHNLTKEEAKIFEKYAKISYKESILAWDEIFFRVELNLILTEIMLLMDINLLNSELNIAQVFRNIKQKQRIRFIFNNRVIIIDIFKDINELTIPKLTLTKSGSQLSKLIEKDYPLKYIEHIGKTFKNKINECNIKIYDLFEIEGKMQYDEEKFIEI